VYEVGVNIWELFLSKIYRGVGVILWGWIVGEVNIWGRVLGGGWYFWGVV
jgi:hypothetical protein